MFWHKEDLTVLDVIERELQRLHSEMNNITWSGDQAQVDPAYALLVAQIDKLNQQLVELSKGERHE